MYFTQYLQRSALAQLNAATYTCGYIHPDVLARVSDDDLVVHYMHVVSKSAKKQEQIAGMTTPVQNFVHNIYYKRRSNPRKAFNLRARSTSVESYMQGSIRKYLRSYGMEIAHVPLYTHASLMEVPRRYKQELFLAELENLRWAEIAYDALIAQNTAILDSLFPV